VSENIYTDFNLLVTPDRHIIEGRAESQFNSCRFGPDGSLHEPLVLTVGPRGEERVAGVPGPPEDDTLIVGTYRLICEKFAPKSDIILTLATVQDSTDPHLPMFSSTRSDPTQVRLTTHYTVRGQQDGTDDIAPLQPFASNTPSRPAAGQSPPSPRDKR
jgi:hypothetical protein